ncbi:MAG: alkaline phosphatase family protein [Flavobacteriales bacterium]|nr:alkaline phosphatase family protein [Flavobacteriales bacterium]
MKKIVIILFVLLVAGCQTDPLPCRYDCADDPTLSDKRVLIIGLDGCRTDAFLQANTPVMDSLSAAGNLYTDVNRGPHTVSAPGWSALLTGVWSDKHGVISNDYSNSHFDLYPDLFTRLKERFPCKRMYYVNSHPIVSEGMLAMADFGKVTGDDAEAASDAAQLMQMCQPDVMFIHLDDIDGEGHDTDFDPQNERYIAEIEDCDRQIGAILRAFKTAFPTQEHLVFVTTDHGGEGGGHGNGDDNLNITHVFMIGSSNLGEIWKDTIAEQVDLYPSVLQFLEVEIDSTWGLDGKTLIK